VHSPTQLLAQQNSAKKEPVSVSLSRYLILSVDKCVANLQQGSYPGMNRSLLTSAALEFYLEKLKEEADL